MPDRRFRWRLPQASARSDTVPTDLAVNSASRHRETGWSRPTRSVKRQLRSRLRTRAEPMRPLARALHRMRGRARRARRCVSCPATTPPAPPKSRRVLPSRSGRFPDVPRPGVEPHPPGDRRGTLSARRQRYIWSWAMGGGRSVGCDFKVRCRSPVYDARRPRPRRTAPMAAASDSVPRGGSRDSERTKPARLLEPPRGAS